MIKKIFLIVLAILIGGIAALAIVVYLQPAHFRVERSATIKAPPDAVFPMVNDFHNWDAWSPWAKLDPQMETTHSGEKAGKGAVYAWTGNDKVGEGRMEILDSRPDELVRIKLDFIKPFEASSTTDFTFKKTDGDQTHVTWIMQGDNGYIAKAFHLFMDIDKAVGGDFEKGLAQLDAAAQAAAKKPPQ
jgi:uncharacterized protein YndB with AHSA1/START domain